jgi:hypothetical protein
VSWQEETRRVAARWGLAVGALAPLGCAQRLSDGGPKARLLAQYDFCYFPFSFFHFIFFCFSFIFKSSI